MKRTEAKYATPLAAETARRLGTAIRAARLARNVTQASAAERARVSPLTWLKIERGDVSVALGSWLAALDQAGLLSLLGEVANPAADRVGAALRRDHAKVRARPSNSAASEFDF